VQEPTATIGCVSYLNARPLVAGLESEPGIRVVGDVPSELLRGLESGQTTVALCPVIDYQTASRELSIVPAGAIGSDGETLTVRAFSSRPFFEVSAVAVDGDSRTSVALLQLVLRDLYGTAPKLQPLPPGRPPRQLPTGVDAILLIGDKVVTAAPELPYQLDLGEAWKRLTGQPFVFATWMCLRSAALGGIPELLRRRRDANRHAIDSIVRAHATAAGWQPALARHYLGTLLRYDIGQRELKAMTTFWARCHEIGLITDLRPLHLYAEPADLRFAEPPPRQLTASEGPIGRG